MRAQVGAARRHLADLLWDDYRRQPHVTIALCGFPARSPRFDDDFGPDGLAAQRQALDAARIAPFEISVGGLDTFDSVPYLRVEGPRAAFAELRRCLATSTLDAPERRYTAHVTVGLYRGAWPLEAVRDRIARLPVVPTATVLVTGVALMGYDTSEVDGPLTVMGRHGLTPIGSSGAGPGPG